MAKTIQDQLAERIKTKFPDAEVKKVNKDNFLDIHLPSVHPKRGTHLFFNTSGGSIKAGFYCREEEFTQQVLAKSTNLEAYSQGVRPKGNPEWKTVDAACTAAFTFVESLSGKGGKEQAAPSKEAQKPKKEKPAPTTSKADELSDFDLTEFDLEGRAVGRKDAPKASSQQGKSEFDLNTFDLSTFGLEGESAPKSPASKAPKGKPADTSLADETDRCLDDPIAFLTCVQQVRNYYLGLSPKSKTYRGAYEETLREYTNAAVVPRITNDMLRAAHEDGNLIEALLLGPMLQAEEIYDKTYATQTDYICGLGKVVADLLTHCNEGLFLDTLEFFMYLGDMLEETESYGGSLAPQDRYFPLFLMLKARPELDVDDIEQVLKKNAHTRFVNYGAEVNNLLLKASGNFKQLSNEEKLGLILYDFILWDEPDAGLDIKLGDIAAARSIFTLVTQNAALGEKLVGGFKDNASYEIFQFFNVEYNRAGFHAFCLERWKELSSEWNPLKLQLLLDRVKRDFHISTYTNNPVLKDYLDVYGGVKVGELKAETASPKAPDSQKIKTVKIGNQTWMVENLNTEFFANGEPIPHAETEEEWAEASQNFEPAWCYYENDPENGKKYGRLYNWYAVNDSRGLAPDGWRIPSEDEFNSLFSFIEEDDEVNDFKLKCADGWGPDSDGTNETGFTALPGGYRNYSDGFIGLYDLDCPEDSYAGWWSASEIEGDPVMAAYRGIEYEFDGYTMFWESDKGTGYSVRCIKE
jgi:uncharacterized protein (TIGR02145 family)